MHRSTIQFALPLFTAMLLVSAVGTACPLCESGTADQVRKGIVAASFDGHAVAALVLPFLVLSLVLAFILLDWRKVHNTVKRICFVNKRNLEDQCTTQKK